MSARRIASRVAYGVVVAAIVLQWPRAIPHSVSGMFQPFWSITYAHGYVRRGLLGTLFQFFASGYSIGEQQFPILVVHVLTLTALIAGVIRETIVLGRTMNARRRAFLMAGVASFLLSKFIITVAYCTGYSDVVLLLLAFLAGRLLDRGRLKTALAVAVVAPFVHEAFVFLWAPAAILFLVSSPRSRAAVLKRAAFSAIPVLSAFIAVKLHSDSALHATLDPLPFLQADKDGIYRYAYGLSLGDAFEASMRGPRELPGNMALGIAWFSIYSWAMIACAVGLDRRPLSRSLPIAFVATFIPCTILFIAWDFSRFLIWSQLGALLVLMSYARSESAETSDAAQGAKGRRSLLTACRGAVIFFATLSIGPHIYLYYNHAFAEWPLGPEILRESPVAKLSYAFINYYNRPQRSSFINTQCSDIEADFRSTKHQEKDKPCSIDLAPHGFLDGPMLSLDPGSYEAQIVVAKECNSARGRLSVVSARRYGRELGATPLQANDPTRLVFFVDRESAAMGFVRVRVSNDGDGACRVEDMTLTRRP